MFTNLFPKKGRRGKGGRQKEQGEIKKIKVKEDTKALPFTVNTEGSQKGTGTQSGQKNREKREFC